MATITFDREALANWYASRHLKTDPDVSKVIYLPDGSPEREIRLIEVSTSPYEMTDESLEPMDFGVERNTENYHVLMVLDVSKDQWSRMASGDLALPPGWSLSGCKQFPE